MGVFLFRKLSAGESTEDGVAIVLSVIKTNADHLKKGDKLLYLGRCWGGAESKGPEMSIFSKNSMTEPRETQRVKKQGKAVCCCKRVKWMDRSSGGKSSWY